MVLTDLAALGSFVSGLAVLVSLAYLTIQIKQTDRNQRSLLVQQRAAAGVEAMFHIAEPQIAEVLAKVRTDPENLTYKELFQFHAAMRARFNWIEDAFIHHEASLLDGLAFEGLVAGLRSDLASPQIRAFWAMYRHVFTPRFVAFVDEMMQAIPVHTVPDILAIWREELAKAKALIAA